MRRSISRAVGRLAEIDPGRVVVRAADGDLTAAELDRRATDLARAYLDLGVRRDDLVTVVLPSSAEAVVVCCAVWRAGATPQPLDPTTDDEALAAVLGLARPALVVGRAPPPTDAGGAAVPWLPAGWEPPEPIERGPLPDAWARSWKAPTTSGSTGAPKVVLAGAPALVDPEVAAAPFLPLVGTQLVVAPLTGSAAFTYAFRGLMTGHRLVLLPWTAGRPDPRRVLDALVRERVTWVQVSPAVLGDLVGLPEDERARADLGALGSVVHLGARCDPEVKAAAIDWLGPDRVVEVYAGSESNGLCVVGGREWLRRPGTVGRPAPGTRVAVRRPDGTPCITGEVGEVWMHRSGGPTYRYLGGASRRTDDGWDTLGDLGRVDADGYLFLVDRADDVVTRGGTTVAPADVEHVLERHPGVRGAAVHAAPALADAPPGARPVLRAVVEVTGATTAAELHEWSARWLPPAARPDVVELSDAPVRGVTGKVRRDGTRPTSP